MIAMAGKDDISKMCATCNSKKLYEEIMSILLDHCGETGKNEGMVKNLYDDCMNPHKNIQHPITQKIMNEYFERSKEKIKNKWRGK
jgi:hypothetical protein